MMTEARKVGVIDAGMMGAEIALCFAMSGYDVCMKETSLSLVQEGKELLGRVNKSALEIEHERQDAR